MRLQRIPVSLTCLILALAACTDEPQDDVADEIGTESESTESESESTGTETTTESESTGTETTTDTETDADTDVADWTDTTDGTETGEEESTSEDEESTSEESTSEEEDEESTNDTDLESCEEVESTYEALVNENTSCGADSDCHVVNGHCWMGLGGCWYVVNQNLKQADLEALADNYQGLECFGPICLCIEPPGAVACIDGTCAPA